MKSQKIAQIRKLHPKNIKLKDENHLLFIGFVMLVAALLIVNTVYVISRGDAIDSKTENHQNMPDALKVLSSQQTAENKAFSVVVSNVTESDKFDPAFTLPDGYTMLLFDIKITNLSRGEQSLIPVNNLFVRSREGDTFPLHPSLEITKPLESGPVAAGATVDGQISFGVPKTLAHPLLYVDLGWDDYVPIVIDVLR